MSHLDTKTVAVHQLVDAALLFLWYANEWGSGSMSTSESLNKDQKEQFEHSARGIVQFLYQNVYVNRSGLVDYVYGCAKVSMPEDWREYFIERETKFQHPTK